MPADPLCHLPDHHNGECIYCLGFSYDLSWWNERCEERVAHKRRVILNRPDNIRCRIIDLQEELEEAIEAAAALPPE